MLKSGDENKRTEWSLTVHAAIPVGQQQGKGWESKDVTGIMLSYLHGFPSHHTVATPT